MFSRFVKYCQGLAKRKKLERRHFIYGTCAVVFFLFGAVFLVNLSPYHAPKTDNYSGFYSDDPLTKQKDQTVYTRAKVLSVQEKSGQSAGQQSVRVRVLDGADKGEIISVDRYDNFGDASYRRLPVGSEVLLFKDISNGDTYTYVDRYRIPGAITLLLFLLLLVVLVARWRGITSVVGLTTSIGVLAFFVIPRIVAGHDAYMTCIQGAFIIATTSIFIAHGFNKRTTVAFVGAIGTLLLTVGITTFSSYVTGLSGFVGEDSLGVQYAQQHISLSGLLFGGIVIASLGVLNDITIGQAAAVDEIHKANKRQSGLQLYRRGMSVGREHIAALVNTLALAYVGVALPAVVTTALYNNAPLVAVLNSETVMEEIVRTAVISISLLLAVPLTTALAAYILPRWNHTVDAKIKKWLNEL